LEPNVYLIADDLEFAKPQKLQWLLHCDKKMQIEQNTIELKVKDAVGRLRFFQPGDLSITQTDQFTHPPVKWRPDKRKREYPNQWHLTAEIEDESTRQQFISVLQVCRSDEVDQLPVVTVKHDDIGVFLRVSDGRHGTIWWRR
jgi:hypothetical protein